MVCAEDAIRIYQFLITNGIQVWLTGGWGIDALLGEQSRPHKDLDLIMLLDDVVRMRELLGGDGYRLKELWSENRWVIDAHGVAVATAFVLQNREGLEIDAHAMTLDDLGNGFPAWEEKGLIFERQALTGEGLIFGSPVRCLTAEMQMVLHTGYELPDQQVGDLEQLHAKFNVKLPEGFSARRGDSHARDDRELS